MQCDPEVEVLRADEPWCWNLRNPPVPRFAHEGLMRHKPREGLGKFLVAEK